MQRSAWFGVALGATLWCVAVQAQPADAPPAPPPSTFQPTDSPLYPPTQPAPPEPGYPAEPGGYGESAASPQNKPDTFALGMNQKYLFKGDLLLEVPIPLTDEHDSA